MRLPTTVAWVRMASCMPAIAFCQRVCAFVIRAWLDKFDDAEA